LPEQGQVAPRGTSRPRTCGFRPGSFEEKPFLTALFNTS
jgi:hypothetical protein